MGNITIQGDLTGDVPGGEVGGASNLTTVGAIPYVSAAGTLNQDPTALFWDAANDRLGVGTNAPSAGYRQTIVAPDSGFGTALYLRNNNLSQALSLGWSGISATSNLSFGAGTATNNMTIATSGNILIGTATDSNFKLDVATSGSAGTARFYGGAGVSNSTKVVVQAGGGQGTSALVSIQDGAASEVARLTDNVNSPFRTYSTGTLKAWFGQNFFMSNSAGAVGWTPTGDASASPDLSLSRASAGVLQVGDGGANANGYLSAARLGVGTNTPASNTVLNGSGNPLSIGSVISTYVGLARGNVAIDTSNYFIASDGSGVLINAPSTDIGFNTANTNRATIKATTGNLLIGTTTDDGTNKLQVAGSVAVQNSANAKAVQIVNSASATGVAALNLYSNVIHTGNSGNALMAIQIDHASSTGTALYVQNDGTGPSAIFDGGNVLIGTNTNLGYGLHAANKGTNGNFLCFDPTATTGVTTCVVRDGAAQAGSSSIVVQNSSSQYLAGFTSNTGSTHGFWVATTAGGTFGTGLTAGGVQLSSTRKVTFSSTTDAFTGTADLGLARNAAGILEVNNGTAGAYRDLLARTITAHNGTATKAILDSANLLVRVANDSMYGFSSTAGATGSIDLALYRSSSGVLEVNNGTAGTYRDILARRHQASGETVASLPAAAAGNAGTISYVTDANATTIGSTVAGGGANKVLVWSNGTAWKIFAN